MSTESRKERKSVPHSILDTNVKIVIPVCHAFHNMDDFSSFDEKYFDFEKDLISGSVLVRYFEKYENDILNGIFSLQDYVNHSLFYESNIKYRYLEFTFSITHIDETKTKENEDLSEEKWLSLLKTGLLYSCEDEYKMFVFSFFLAFPIPTVFEKGIILCNNKIFYQTDKYTNSFDCDKCIDFQKCWNYLHNKSKFKFGRSQNNAPRFISILSKMSGAEDIISQIFYATMALEAVYARSTSEGIARQIIEKVKLFLNTEVNEKKLKRLYDIQSRYIHGDIDIQLSFLNYDAVSENSLDELYELFLYANEILYITAKRIIEEDIATIDFDYNLKLSK